MLGSAGSVGAVHQLMAQRSPMLQSLSAMQSREGGGGSPTQTPQHSVVQLMPGSHRPVHSMRSQRPPPHSASERQYEGGGGGSRSWQKPRHSKGNDGSSGPPPGMAQGGMAQNCAGPQSKSLAQRTGGSLQLQVSQPVIGSMAKPNSQ